MPWYEESHWEDRIDMMQQGQEAEFGEPMVLIPRLDRPNKRPIDDPIRPRTDFRGIFTRPYVADNFNPSALSTKGLRFTDLAQRQPSVQVRANQFPFEIQQGDLILRPRTGARYVVTVPEATGDGVINVNIIEEGISGNSP